MQYHTKIAVWIWERFEGKRWQGYQPQTMTPFIPFLGRHSPQERAPPEFLHSFFAQWTNWGPPRRKPSRFERTRRFENRPIENIILPWLLSLITAVRWRSWSESEDSVSIELTDPSKLFSASFSPPVVGIDPIQVWATWFCSVVVDLKLKWQDK